MHRIRASVWGVAVLLALLLQPIAAWALQPDGPHSGQPNGGAVRPSEPGAEVRFAPVEERLRALVSKSDGQPDALPRALAALSLPANRPRPDHAAPLLLRNDPAVLRGPVRGPPSR